MSLLELLDPEGKGYIDLEDMKTLLCKLPGKEQALVSSIFKNYIFQTHDFRMPNSAFQSLLAELNFSGPKRSNTFQPAKRVVCDLSQLTPSSTSDFSPMPRSLSVFSSKRSSTPSKRKSASPLKIKSYAERHAEKKAVTEKVWEEAHSIYDSVCKRVAKKNDAFYKPLRSQIEPMPISMSRFVGKYDDVEALLQVRRQHLNYSSVNRKK